MSKIKIITQNIAAKMLGYSRSHFQHNLTHNFTPVPKYGRENCVLLDEVYAFQDEKIKILLEMKKMSLLPTEQKGRVPEEFKERYELLGEVTL
jgi:hypothetical protein